MLEVNQLTRWYGEFKAVDNVSFKIGKGEIVGLLGHNGAGKTTIMKMLSGYLEPNAGSITINGMNTATELKPIQRKLGYLPENLPVYPEMTVADYLDYAAVLKGLTAMEKAKELKRAVDATDLEVKLFDPIATLSRGYKQRVGVAQAILGKPKLLILDEPTNGLDPTQTEHMRELIKDIAKDATVILSTHIMQEVDALCDRAIIIRNGQLAVNAKLKELRQSNNIHLISSLDQTDAERLFGNMVEVESIDSTQNSDNLSTGKDSPIFELNIKLKTTDEPLNIRSQIAQKVVQAGAELYTIKQENIDLETLFKQVNQGLINMDGDNLENAKLEAKNAA